MTLKPIILFVAFTLSSFKVAAQLLFAPSTNTPVIEYPYDAVELPGNRYALSIAKRTGTLPNDHSFMELVITDSVGTIQHYVLYPGDSSVNIYPRDIYYQDGKLYSVALVDSTTQDPGYLHLSVWDTSLNLMFEKVHRVCDSGWRIFESYSVMHAGRIYSIEARTATGDHSGAITHPLLSVYDTTGNLVNSVELDTTYFPQLAGGDNYSIIPKDLTIGTDGLIYLNFVGRKIVSNWGVYETYLCQIDDALAVTSTIRFTCWDSLCDTSFGYQNFAATSGGRLLGYFNTLIWGSNLYNSIVKVQIPSGLSGAYIRPASLELIPDNTTGTSIIKALGRKAISIYGESVYTCGQDFHSFNPAVNHLIISRSDTNGQIVWTKYLPSDGRPFEPRFILATSDGGCLVAASVLDGLTNPYDHYIFKLDGNGHFTSVHRLELEKERVVKVYPNPASSVLNFELDKAGEYSIVISDMTGRRVLQHKVKGVSQTFDVRHLAEGMYQYAVYGAEGVIDSGLWLKR